MKKRISISCRRSYGNRGKKTFISAELEVSGRQERVEAGFDRQHDPGIRSRIQSMCFYFLKRRLLEIRQTARTACCILVDKEEGRSVALRYAVQIL